MTDKWLWLDMDGTIADLYGVDGWLEDIHAHNTRPYAIAKMLYDEFALLKVLTDLKFNCGYHIGIISWGSKESNPIFDKQIELAKRLWLAENDLDLILDEIIVTPYGVRKADTCRKFGSGILVDDEEQNRKDWDLGLTINANSDIIKSLENLLEER